MDQELWNGNNEKLSLRKDSVEKVMSSSFILSVEVPCKVKVIFFFILKAGMYQIIVLYYINFS